CRRSEGKRAGHAGGSRRRGRRRSARHRPEDCRRRALGRALAQAGRAQADVGRAPQRGRPGLVLRLLRERGFPHRPPGFPRQPAAGAPGAMSAAARSGPLAGMRVLELAQIMAGPTCGLMLADLGADVVKVEKIAGGDDARNYRVPSVQGVSVPFMMLNRNKRSLALDLKTAEGKDIFLHLVERADVVLENFRRGTLEAMGLGYETLARINRGLIYCAITGFGGEGRGRAKGAFALTPRGFAGLMSVPGEPGRPPVKNGNPVSDINAGILATAGIAAAYAHKLATGQGQLVDTSLM